MSPQALVQAFAAVFPAELPDKTMVATIVLVARYRRPLLVWIGAASAFTVHVVIAVAAGSAISLLPDRLVKAAVAALFTIGAILLFRAARSAGDDEVASDDERANGARTALVGSFGLIVLAEWGDLTQLATTSLAASSGEPVATALGALLALGAVAGIAATFGRQLIARVPIQRVNYIAGGVFAALAAWTLVDLAT